MLLYFALFGGGVIISSVIHAVLRWRSRRTEPSRNIKTARLSKLATQRHVAMGKNVNYSINQGHNSFIETWNCETDFVAIRLIYGSVVGGSNFGVGGASVSAAESVIYPGSPMPNAGGEQLVPVTFNNDGVAVAFEQQALFSKGKAVRELPFPPLADIADGDTVWSPKLMFSDWVMVRSMDRKQRGRGTLLRIHTLVKDGQRLTGPKTMHRDGIDAADQLSVTGFVYQKICAGGDHVFQTSPLLEETLNPNAIGRGAVYAVQFMTKYAGATVQAVGDSILQGVGFECGPHTGNYISFAHIACGYVSSPRLPVTLLQSAVGGEPSADFFASARADLEHADVAVALIQTWSGNDIGPQTSPAQSVAAADAAWERAVAYAALIRAQGGIPIFLSAVPQAPKMGSTAAEEARLSSVKRCNALAQKGELVLDLNSILGDGAKITNYKARWMWIDNIHPNTAAHYALAERTAELIGLAIGNAESPTSRDAKFSGQARSANAATSRNMLVLAPEAAMTAMP